MADHCQLGAQVRGIIAPPTPRKRQPWDGTTKKKLWNRVEELESQIERAASACQTVATQAHNLRAGADVYSPDPEDRRKLRRRLTYIFDLAYSARAKVRGEKYGPVEGADE